MPSPSEEIVSPTLQTEKEAWRFGHNERTTYCQRFKTFMPTKTHDRICNGQVNVRRKGFMPVILACGKP